MGLSQRQHVLEQDIHQTSTTQQGALGTVGETKDGRVFRYGLAGASNLALGKLAQQPAVVTTHQNVVVSGTAGEYTATVTLGATNAMTVDQYKDGYLSGLSGTGAGQTVRIRGNPAIAAAASGVLQLAEPLTTTFASTPKASLTLNPYAGAIISASGETTDQVVGVPIVTIPAASYGWFQVKGIAAVLGNGTITKGAGLIKSATTAGAVDIEATGTITTRVGVCYDTAGASTSYITAMLNVVI